MAFTPGQENMLRFVMNQLGQTSLDPAPIIEYIFNNLALLQDQAQIDAAVKARDEADKAERIVNLTATLESLTGGKVVIDTSDVKP